MVVSPPPLSGPVTRGTAGVRRAADVSVPDLEASTGDRSNRLPTQLADIDMANDAFYSMTGYSYKLQDVFDNLSPSVTAAVNLVLGLAVGLRQCDDWFDASCRGELGAVIETVTPLIVCWEPISQALRFPHHTDAAA